MIHCLRPSEAGIRASTYAIVKIDDGEGLKQALSAALGIRGQVRKQRRLFLVGRSRIHFDTVVGLGQYIEIEVVMDDGQEMVQGEIIAGELMARLGIDKTDLVAGAYIDLLENR